MLRKLLFCSILLITGCSGISDKFTRWNNPPVDPAAAEKIAKAEKAEKLARVVFTPLIPSRPPTDPTKMEILLRTPTVPYKELAFVSMYRSDPNETGATMLPLMKERAAMDGADAIILMEIGEKQIGTRSSGAAFPIGDVVFANASTSPVTEGTIRGIAIVYGK